MMLAPNRRRIRLPGFFMLHLRSRILLVLSGTALVFIAAMYAIERVTLLPSFLELEQEHAIANLERGVAALQNEVAFVGDFVGDWSGWDDTYAFVHDQNEDYTKSNLDSNAFRPDSFDFLSFINLKGKEIWRGCEVAGERLAVPEIPTGNWPLDHVLLQPREPDDCATGILATSWGSMLLASRPISDSAREAKPNGWLVMGRFLSPARQKKLAEQTNLDLMGRPIANATSGDLLATAARLANGDNYDLHAVDDWHLTTSARVRGLTGDHDDLMLVVSQDRRILKQARTTLAYALVAMVLMVLPLFAVLMWLLHRTVVAPVTQLKDHALLIRASDDLTRRCAMDREDEIGTLAKEFDGMVERLAASQAQMMVHAR
jgi:two-component system, NtrC family, sensor kinase